MTMGTFFTIVAKDLRVRFSRPPELVFFLLLPIVFTVVLAGIGGGGAARSAPRVVLVQDHVRTPASRGMVALLGRDPALRVREVSDPSDLLRDGSVDLLLLLEPAVPAGSKPFAARLRLSPWRGSAGETARRVGEWLSGSTPPAPSASAPAVTSAPSNASGAATGNAGQIVTWVLVPLLGLGSGFIADRRRGTLRRILASPARRWAVMAGTAGAEMIAAFVQVALLVLFGTFAFHLPWLSHGLELAVLAAAFCLAGAALGSLLGSFCKTERQAGSLGLAAALVLAVLGGCWYPATNFPAAMKMVSRLDPAGWAMDGFIAVLAPGTGAGAALRSAGLLAALGAAAFFLAAAVWRARGRRMVY
jgi:ABC-2 type transport system permease protein